jgi:hypothetical protein
VQEDALRNTFITDYGSSLKEGSNYELAYEVVEGDYNILFSHAIREANNDLVKLRWSRDKDRVSLAYASPRYF